MKVFKFFSGHYGLTWNQNQSSERVENVTACWNRAMDGLSEDQINFGANQISLALHHVDFPPNAGQFRRLCLSMPDERRFFAHLEHVKKCTDEIAAAALNEIKTLFPKLRK